MANIRWSTDLITFYNTGVWGFEPDLPHTRWVEEYEKDPRRYYDGMLDLAARSGIEGVEFPPDPAGWQSALEVYGSTRGVREALESRGLVASSGYTHGRILIGDALLDAAAEPVADDHIERHAVFLRELGADIIVIGNVPRAKFADDREDGVATAEQFEAPVPRELHERVADQLNRMGAVAGRHGVRLAIHTDAYSVCSRPEDVATLMSMTDPATVQLCPDAGHITLDGGDAVRVLRENIERVPTMHWKDCIEPLPGHLLQGVHKERHHEMVKRFRILGTGKVDWIEWMHVLRDNRWSGWATEEIDHSPDPVGELLHGRTFFDDVLAPIYS